MSRAGGKCRFRLVSRCPRIEAAARFGLLKGKEPMRIHAFGNGSVGADGPFVTVRGAAP